MLGRIDYVEDGRKMLSDKSLGYTLSRDEGFHCSGHDREGSNHGEWTHCYRSNTHARARSRKVEELDKFPKSCL